jgi:hypothetical protein
MTDPTDLLADTLRQALSETAGAFTPGADGLGKIRAKIGGRPPRPWLLSMVAHGAERARYWTWRGHWAWPSLSSPAAIAWPGSRPTRGAHRRSRTGSEWGFGGLRLVSVLGGIVVIAGLSFGVQPFRHAIIQASSNVLDGKSPTASGGGGTDGHGTPASAQGGGPASVGASGQGGATASGQPRPGPSGTATSCASPSGSRPAATPATTTAAADDTADDTQPADTASPSATASAKPAAKKAPAACPADSPSAKPSASSSPAPSTTDTFPTSSPTPTDPDSDGYDSPPDTSVPTDPSSYGGGGGGGGGGSWQSDNPDPDPTYPYGWGGGGGWYQQH